jgi:hypothetical protein
VDLKNKSDTPQKLPTQHCLSKVQNKLYNTPSPTKHGLSKVQNILYNTPENHNQAGKREEEK